jgi:hypothetical protein
MDTTGIHPFVEGFLLMTRELPTLDTSGRGIKIDIGLLQCPTLGWEILSHKPKTGGFISGNELLREHPEPVKRSPT